MACVNIKHPEYINLVSRLSEFGITNPVDIQAYIHEYQEETNSDNYPDISYFSNEFITVQGDIATEEPSLFIYKGDNLVGHIILENTGDTLIPIHTKVYTPGRGIGSFAYELLNKLASSNGLQLMSGEKQTEAGTNLWESLVRNNKAEKLGNRYYYKQQENKQSNQKQLDVITSLDNNITNLIKDFEGTDFKSEGTINIVYKNRTVGNLTLNESIDKSSVQITRVNIKEEFRGQGITEKLYRILPYKYSTVFSDFEIVNPIIRNIYEKLVREGLADKFEENDLTAYKLKQKNQEQLSVIEPSNSVKEGVDFVFEQNPELQKIGNKQAYSQYLDTIFPDSKVKDIVWHTNIRGRIESFNSERGLFVTPTWELAKTYKPGINGKRFQLLINSQDIDFTSEDIVMKGKKQQGDTLAYSEKDYTEYVVFKSEQIHILGSEKDIEGFKNYVNNTQVKQSDITTNFEQYFPDYAYLNQDERQIFIKGIESGDITITCTK